LGAFVITLLIGHRGTGKTSLLKRIKRYRSDSECIDLDAFISQKENCTIFDIFEKKGERFFRNLEHQCLEQILSESRNETFVALGAGFDLSAYAGRFHMLWVRRDTDEQARIFLDRPRLDQTTNPMVEYQSRFFTREALYAKYADEVLTVEEGVFEFSDFENRFFNNSFENLNCTLTLNAELLKKPRQREYIQKRLSWGAKFIELRNDQLSEKEIMDCCEWIPSNQILLSFRKNPSQDFVQSLKSFSVNIDWDLSLGEYPSDLTKPLLFSLHPDKVDFQLTSALLTPYYEAVQKLKLANSQKPPLFKMALKVDSFDELKKFHSLTTDSNVLFYPISGHKNKGSWHWYRLSQSSRHLLNFVREGWGAAKATSSEIIDQPSLAQWVNSRSCPNKEFAAVLGAPVNHSYSSSFHRKFFQQREMSFYNIHLESSEFIQAMPFLFELGLRAAAITSPLKQEAFLFAPSKDSLSQELQSVNTLIFDKNSNFWRAFNTDLDGLKALLWPFFVSASNTGKTVVWGGGGVLQALKKSLPHAAFYSASLARPRLNSKKIEDPSVLVWAAGGAPLDLVPQSWRPKLIVDLSYLKSSPARQLAIACGARYVSGLEMFVSQAKMQQEIWKSYC